MTSTPVSTRAAHPAPTAALTVAPGRPWTADRVAELDGLRGIAVLLVLAFHVSDVLVPGGFLGVDLFFVLSGFLITGLLVRQVDGGGIAFRRFYLRRARRLLPPALLTAGAVAGYVLLADPVGATPDQADRTLLGALTALAHVSNVVLAVEGAGAIGLMGHTWSLSVEEHFYLVWPVLLALLARRCRTRPRLLASVAGLLAAAVALPFVLLAAGAGTERVYFGTDTRAWYLLAGCLLALALAGEDGRRRAAALLHPAGAAAALAVLLGGALLLDRTGGAYYRGGAVLVVLAACWLIAVAVLAPRSRAAGLLRSRPLVRLGTWSYGLYLYHYPLFLLAYDVLGADTEPQRTAARAAAVLLAVPVAWASFRWVERPVVERGFRGAAFGRGLT